MSSCTASIHQETRRGPFAYGHGAMASARFPVLTHSLWRTASPRATLLHPSITPGLGDSEGMSPNSANTARGAHLLADKSETTTLLKHTAWVAEHSAACFTASLHLNRILRDGSAAFIDQKGAREWALTPGSEAGSALEPTVTAILLWTKTQNVCSDLSTKFTANCFRTGVVLDVQRNKKLSIQAHFC